MLEATDLMVFYENMLALNNISITCKKTGSPACSGPTLPANPR